MNAYYEIYRDGKEEIACDRSCASFAAHFHKGVEVIACVEDGVQMLHNGKQYLLNKDEVVVVRSFDVHQFLGDKLYDVIILPPVYLRHFDAYCNGRVLSNVHLTPETGSLELIALMHRFFELTHSNKLERQGLSDQLLGALVRLCGLSEQANSADMQTARRLLVHLSENCTHDITLEHTAQTLGFSKYHLSHILKQTTGMNFSQYLNELRIQQFESLIYQDAQRDILTAAFEAGFQSAPTFYRVFKSSRGMTPRTFAKMQTKGEKR